MCTHDATGKMDCVPIAALGLSNLDGRLCGDDTTCSTVCQGTVCATQQAPDGLACRPTNNHDRCAGACLSGQCVLVEAANRCTYGRQGQTRCVFEACDMFNATTCVTVSIGTGVSCNDNDTCTVGDVCNGSGSCGINICDGGTSLDGGSTGSGDGSGSGGSTGSSGSTGSGGAAGSSSTTGSAPSHATCRALWPSPIILASRLRAVSTSTSPLSGRSGAAA